jgi:hypothetical protein
MVTAPTQRTRAFLGSQAICSQQRISRAPCGLSSSTDPVTPLIAVVELLIQLDIGL